MVLDFFLLVIMKEIFWKNQFDLKITPQGTCSLGHSIEIELVLH